MCLKKLPIGIDQFEKIRSDGFYYVDKTGLIKELLSNWGEVNLFTRPRRFGKSLNMDMLKKFFEFGCEKSIFDGLRISVEKELCDQYMGRFPVISLSLKGVRGKDFGSARSMICSAIGIEALRFQFLLESEVLSEIEKSRYQALITLDEDKTFFMPEEVLINSLLMLSSFLQKHYGQKVIILIDEYDVPLARAYEAGYYDEMAELIRSIFHQTLKGNEYMLFSVLTGCMRISRESIFTGLNNPNILSITERQFDEYFGFTDQEVRELLQYYGLERSYDTIKEWYDGYLFGRRNVYCPWDVVSYCYALRADPDAEPQNYWSNTSSNDVIRRFINKADRKTQDEIERLIAGEAIDKEIRQELTYKDLDTSVDHLWSVLFTTGYLTRRGKSEGRKLCLAIPNMEIREIFITQIKEWFKNSVVRNRRELDKFCLAFSEGRPEDIETGFNLYLRTTISIRDTFTEKPKKENFFHGILLGLLSHMENWSISSNAESGEGYSDILVRDYDSLTGIVIEVKYAEDGSLEKGCQKALTQIEDKGYEEALKDDGMEKILKYGIACYKKRCRVKLAV